MVSFTTSTTNAKTLLVGVSDKKNEKAFNSLLKKGQLMRHSFIKIITLIIIAGFIVTPLPAQNHHHTAPHVHGEATLNIVFQKEGLYIEFSSPAANIVGFEHSPRTQNQKRAIKDAMDMLKQSDGLFTFNGTAKVILKKDRIDTDIDPAHPSDHGSKTNHHDRHSEFTATYYFICHQPKMLSSITVRLFKRFPRIGKIRVQLLTETKQTAILLKPLKNKITLN